MNTFGQFFRFVLVGAISNAVLYILYLVATSVGIEHKVAMTGLFVVGVLQTFVANKSWSFRHQGGHGSALTRYLFAYLLAYLLNLTVMIEMVDRRGYSDRAVQGVMVVVVAALLFVAQKFWVFRAERNTRSVEHL